MNFRNFVKYWLPVIAFAGFIFILSSMPQPMPSVELFPHSDKLFHILEYGVLGFLLIRALDASKKNRSSLGLRVAAVILAFLYGMSDELHQYFVPGRNAELLDLLSNGFGAYIGQIFFKLRG